MACNVRYAGPAIKEAVMISPVLPVYKRNPLAFERGEGCYLYTAEGERYLDFVAGIAVAAFGHANSRLIKALEAQAHKVWIVSNMFTVPGQIRVAEKLKKLSFADTVFFTNSGVEAWECGVKIIRRHFWSKGQPAAQPSDCLPEGLFHGRTMGAVSAAARLAKMCDGFRPAARRVSTKCPINDSRRAGKSHNAPNGRHLP
jgi:acetylornithine/N-succinyldiaminopimelate aminotransferase